MLYYVILCYIMLYVGTYRTDIIVLLFSRLIDPRNFHLVTRHLLPYEVEFI